MCGTLVYMCGGWNCAVHLNIHKVGVLDLLYFYLLIKEAAAQKREILQDIKAKFHAGPV